LLNKNASRRTETPSDKTKGNRDQLKESVINTINISATWLRAAVLVIGVTTSVFCPVVANGNDLNAPKIAIIEPNCSTAIRGPINIDVRFQAAKGATVDPATLKIRYGLFHIDVTRRILDAAGVQVSASGFKTIGAQLPRGNHQLSIEITDSAGRTGRQLVAFTVE
jgi:hypothetical protein